MLPLDNPTSPGARGGSSGTIVGANSNLHQSVGIHLKFQKNDVCHFEFSCRRVFYRPDNKTNEILVLKIGCKEMSITCDILMHCT